MNQFSQLPNKQIDFDEVLFLFESRREMTSFKQFLLTPDKLLASFTFSTQPFNCMHFHNTYVFFIYYYDVVRIYYIYLLILVHIYLDKNCFQYLLPRELKTLVYSETSRAFPMNTRE